MAKVADPYLVTPTRFVIAYPASYRVEHAQTWPSASNPIRGRGRYMSEMVSQSSIAIEILQQRRAFLYDVDCV